MLTLLGILVALSAVMGAFVFHLGWRSKHPGERWPVGAALSFGGGLLGAAGLVLGSWVLVAGGAGLYILARIILSSPVA